MADGASLTVMGGPMAGTRLVIDDAVDEILVGSDPDCRLSLDMPGVSPIHARVWRDLGGMTVYDTRSPRGLYINDARVVDQGALHDGDVLWLGPPGDPDSVMIQCRLPEDSVLGAPVPAAGSTALAATPAATNEEPPPPVVGDALDNIDEAWAAQAAEESAAETPAIAPDPAAPAADDAAWLVDVPPPADPAPRAKVEEEMPAPPMDEAWLGDMAGFETPTAEVTDDLLGAPTPMEPTPSADPTPTEVPTPMAAPTASAPAPAADAPEDFVMDPAWGEYDANEAPAAVTAVTDLPVTEAPLTEPPAFDMDSLLADERPLEPPPPPAPTPAPPPPPVAPAAVAQRPEPAAPPPAPTPVGTATAPFVVDGALSPPVRQLGGTPPLTPAPSRAIIDDTRPQPAPRKTSGSARPGATEGVMDWAKGSSSDADDSPAPVAAPPARPSVRTSRVPVRTRRAPLLPIVGGLVVLAALVGGYFAWTASRTPRIDAVRPARGTTGHTVTLSGSHLGDIAGATTAVVGGRPARVLRTAADRLEIEIPELPTTAGSDISFPIVVTTGGRQSNAASVAVYQAPRLRSLTPDVGMPGEDVVLSGTSFGAGVKVRFGDLEAQVVSEKPDSLTVKVPALPGALGTEVPVVAAMGPDPSNPLTFVIGKVPLVTGIEPRSASPGDLVTVSGRGFNFNPIANRVTVGGTPALVLTAGARGLEFVVPRVIAGEGTVSITVPGSSHAGQEEISITVLPEPIGFRFVAEPFEDVPGHEHAALATGLGPAFILTSSQGKNAADRAYEAQKKFNEAGQVLRSTRTAEIRARYDPAPAVYLVTRDGVLLDATAADAEAYNEDWTRNRARGAPVTPARLATWWEAVARDLVLLLLRGEKPEHALALAPEGKVLADLHDAARRTVAVGVPSAVVAEVRGPMREALRVVALRVPSTVSAPVTLANGATPAADGLPPLRLVGSWRGSETETGIRKPITVVFRGNSGTLTYERALSMSVPVLAVQQPQRGAVHFEVRVGSGTRFYRGRWDGSRITGKLSSDSAGRTEVGTFELEPAA